MFLVQQMIAMVACEHDTPLFQTLIHSLHELANDYISGGYAYVVVAQVSLSLCWVVKQSQGVHPANWTNKFVNELWNIVVVIWGYQQAGYAKRDVKHYILRNVL